MSVKTYAYFFRILYNATYLGHTYSEKALELLNNREFPDGIVAGVPENIPVAHKFGERTVESPEGIVTTEELHDCGIVYYPSKPYILCVMTKGTDIASLKEIIKTISKTVSDEVAAGFPG